MRWLYRLQTRLGLTAPEGTALLVVSLALGLGFAASEWTARAAAPAAELYAAQDSAFAAVRFAAVQGVAAPAAGASEASDGAHAAEPPPAVPELPSLADGALPPDTTQSTAAEPPAASASVAGASVAGASVADAPRRSRRKPPPVVTNLNTASEAELQRLPRIGPALAGRIAEYRRQHGRFRTVEQVVEVRGIGEKTLETLRPWLRL